MLPPKMDEMQSSEDVANLQPSLDDRTHHVYAFISWQIFYLLYFIIIFQ